MLVLPFPRLSLNKSVRNAGGCICILRLSGKFRGARGVCVGGHKLEPFKVI